MPLGGSPPLQSGEQNQKWPTSGQSGYITLAAWGVPTASERGAESEVAHKWARWLHNPCRFGGGGGPLQSGGQNQRWPTSGEGGHITLAAWGVPTASVRGGAESEVAHKWARWLHNPGQFGAPHRFSAGGQNQRWPTSGQGGYITLAAWGVPTASVRGGQNQRWPTSGQGGYITLAAWGLPTASERGAESEVAHKWATWLHNPCRLGGPHRSRAGGQNQKWPTSGQRGKVET